MKNIFSILLVLLAVTFSAYATKSPDRNNDGQHTKTLVAFFSAQGHTKAAAGKVAAVTGGDMFEKVQEVRMSQKTARHAPKLQIRLTALKNMTPFFLDSQSGGLPHLP